MRERKKPRVDFDSDLITELFSLNSGTKDTAAQEISNLHPDTDERKITLMTGVNIFFKNNKLFPDLFLSLETFPRSFSLTYTT